MPLTFTTTTAIAQGPRDHQEDRIHASPVAVWVCDGMGGHPDGDVAAQTAIDHLAPLAVHDADGLRKAIVEAGRAVLALGSGDPHDPGTTAVGAVLADDALLVGWCGDSRLHVVRDGQIRFATTDHAGPFGGLVRCLGAGQEPAPDVEVLDAAPGDRVVVCSDGVVAALGRAADRAVVEAADADELMATCRAAGLGDNTAVVVAEVTDLVEPLPPRG